MLTIEIGKRTTTRTFYLGRKHIYVSFLLDIFFCSICCNCYYKISNIIDKIVDTTIGAKDKDVDAIKDTISSLHYLHIHLFPKKRKNYRGNGHGIEIGLFEIT